MQGRRIVITGGFGVLGQAVARAARERGASVGLIDRAPTPEAVVGDSQVGEVDLGSSDEAARAIDDLARELGGIDALINVAGGFRWQTLELGSTQAWSELFAVNVLTAANAAKAALPHLLISGRGRIVNVGANAALKGSQGMGPYAAAKCGVHRLTESLAEELKGRGVTVNAVLPSILDTPTNRAEMRDADASLWVRPEELAAIILFLCSDDAAPINGALLPVVGGL